MLGRQSLYRKLVALVPEEPVPEIWSCLGGFGALESKISSFPDFSVTGMTR